MYVNIPATSFALVWLALPCWTQEFRPDIPRAWDDKAVEALEVPLAQRDRSPRYMSSEEYYKLKVRPIYHRLADRVRAHILLCMLAYYVEWHLREAWRELLFADPDQQAKATRDPVAPAQRSAAALAKVRSHKLDDASPVHSFATLIAELATIVRNTCLTHTSAEAATFDLLTTPTPKQRRALELVQQMRL